MTSPEPWHRDWEEPVRRPSCYSTGAPTVPLFPEGPRRKVATFISGYSFIYPRLQVKLQAVQNGSGWWFFAIHPPKKCAFLHDLYDQKPPALCFRGLKHLHRDGHHLAQSLQIGTSDVERHHLDVARHPLARCGFTARIFVEDFLALPSGLRCGFYWASLAS